MGNSNLPKIIGSIVTIIIAVLLIVWQVKSHGPKKYAVNEGAIKDEQLENTATREVFDAAVAVAVVSGWESTSKFWGSGRFNNAAKKKLKATFSSSFAAADLKDVCVSRDSESGRQCAIFEYKGSNYVFYFVKNKQGKYQIFEFNAW